MLLDILRGGRVAQETRVAPHILEAAATQSRKLGEAIGQPAAAEGPPTGGVMRDVVPASEQAANGLANWQTQNALKRLVHRQGDDLSRLSKRMAAIAEALEASANAYRRNENANAALFRRAEQRW